MKHLLLINMLDTKELPYSFFFFPILIYSFTFLDYAKKPLTSDEAVKIQNLLKAALEELTDDHVLLVLKRSLLLYFKVCLHPYPAPNRENLPGPEGRLESITTQWTTTSKLNCVLYPRVDP